MLFYSIVWKMLEFPALGDDLHGCSLKNVYKRIKLISSFSAQNNSDFSKFSEILCAGMAIFAIHCSFWWFPDYSGFLSESGE